MRSKWGSAGVSRRRLLQAGGAGSLLGVAGLDTALPFAELQATTTIPSRLAWLFEPRELFGAQTQVFFTMDVSALTTHLDRLPRAYETALRQLELAGVALDDLAQASGIAGTRLVTEKGSGAIHLGGEFDVAQIERTLQQHDQVTRSSTVEGYPTYRCSVDDTAAVLGLGETDLHLGSAVDASASPTRAIELLVATQRGDVPQYYTNSPTGQHLFDALQAYPVLAGLESTRFSASEVKTENATVQPVLEGLRGIGAGSQISGETVTTATVLAYRTDDPPVGAVEALVRGDWDSQPPALLSDPSITTDGSLVSIETTVDPAAVPTTATHPSQPLDSLPFQTPALSRDRVWTPITRLLSQFTSTEGRT